MISMCIISNMKALTTLDIDHILTNNSVTSQYYIGTYPACILPYSDQKQYSFVTNVENHSEKGLHWTAWYVQDNTILFFDSFGRRYDDETLPGNFKEFVKSFDKVVCAKKRVQSWTSVTCGHFCINFLYLLSLGLDFRFFLNQYTYNFEKNDEEVFEFYQSICD